MQFYCVVIVITDDDFCGAGFVNLCEEKNLCAIEQGHFKFTQPSIAIFPKSLL